MPDDQFEEHSESPYAIHTVNNRLPLPVHVNVTSFLKMFLSEEPEERASPTESLREICNGRFQLK